MSHDPRLASLTHLQIIQGARRPHEAAQVGTVQCIVTADKHVPQAMDGGSYANIVLPGRGREDELTGEAIFTYLFNRAPCIMSLHSPLFPSPPQVLHDDLLLCF